MLHVNPAAVADVQLWDQWLESLPVDDAPPPRPVCGMCVHHRDDPAFTSQLTGKAIPARQYCSLRARADLHCAMSSSNPYAAQCPFYVEEVPF